MYIFAISPFSVPDESRHFATAYAQSSSITGKADSGCRGKSYNEFKHMDSGTESNQR